MTKLSDTKLILLSTAAQRGNASIYPLPDTLNANPSDVRKAVTSLIKSKLAEEGEVQNAATAWREADGKYYGVRITYTGRAAIGASDDSGSAQNVPETPAASAATKQTKAGLVLEMLQRAEGATLDELVAATGWLPHTTRAALTGLRKKGHQIDKGKRGDATCYSAAAKA